jgi:outer membrane protein assembly factor BamB
MNTRTKRRLLALVISGAGLFSASCAASHSNAPLLSVPPSATADNDIYMADAEGRIRSLRPDGTEQWICSLPDEIARSGAASSHDLRIDYLAARSGGKLFGLAVDLSGGNAGRTILFALDGNHLLWQISAPFPEQNRSPMAVGSAAVYEAGNDGILYAFARTDGRQLWSYQVSQGTLGSPTVGTDGTVYVTGPRHNLHAVSPDGVQRWAFETK